MIIKILGSGSAYGLPMCFNHWGEIKDRTHPYNQRSRFSVYLEDNGHKILIDMGPEFRLQTLANNITDIDGVFLTHGHYDHIAGVPELFRAAALLGKQINVYAAEETLAELKRCYGYMFGTYQENGKDRIRWLEIKNGNNLIENMDWTCFELPHNRIHSWGFRYKNFALVTDYDNLTQQVLDCLHGLALLLLECNNGMQQVRNGHSNWIKIQPYLEQLQPQKTILTHLSAKVDYESFKSLLPPQIDLAYDGMEIKL